MSDTSDADDGVTTAELDPETRALLHTVEANADELRELVELVVVTKQLGEELTPEMREAATDAREPLADLRVALEREETVTLLETVGHNAEDLAELVEFASATKGLAEDIAPELREAATDAREPMAQLRVALEREETFVLVRKLGENADTFIELLDLLDASHGLLEELVPELREAATDARDPIADLRLMIAGFTDVQEDADFEPYELGQSLGRALSLGATVGDPRVVETVDAGLGAFTEEEPPDKLGPLGVLRALFDDDVQAGLGQLVEAIRRMGANSRK
ncbi:DUF1641 domain-containing protein [Halorientalis brevis]|uniref:DUF1641 domain-containing protein n=1 Tax=Halorientalis brevis TaxID=1126241 RepID=A0ABD6CDC3_9EURY|nr:DUF1641 domain-containing protein [Halorientalis brevis]